MSAKDDRRAESFTVKNFFSAVKYTKNAVFNGKPAQLAAGVAYYGTLSFFPLVAALVAIASLTLTKAQVATIVNGLATYVPKDIASLLSTQLQYASAHQQANVIIMIVALGFSIFGVSGAMDSIIKSITTIHHVKESRTFIKQKLISIILTVGFIVGMALVLPLLFIGENILTAWGMPETFIALFSVVRWLILIAVAMIGLGVVYHFALPNRRTWRWLSWGSVVATVLWLAITAALFIYLQSFANFSNSYSLFAGIIALMIWIDFSALAVLVGAYVDREFAS
jgi:membrane protein